MVKRKIRLQKIERGWAKEWKEYKYVTPKFAKKFALKPPCKRPSPGEVVNVPSALEGSEEYDDETLQAIIRNKQERVAQATGSTIPLALDPKELLNFIDLWHEDPDTPIDDLKLPPGVSHMVATFINEAKWKDQQAKQARLAKIKKEKFLKQNPLILSPEKLVSTQALLKTVTDRYTSLHADQKGAKVQSSKPQLQQLMNTIARLPLQSSQQMKNQQLKKFLRILQLKNLPGLTLMKQCLMKMLLHLNLQR
ncbi:hypothetical protein ZWY2020_028186 [Hordeum vulgare]|nr:hypothetical protein ZWY2020_028186 [Hordeum vulgare]